MGTSDNSVEKKSKGITNMDTDDIKILTKLLCKDEDLFVDFLRKLCAEKDAQDKKESVSIAHPTDENTK